MLSVGLTFVANGEAGASSALEFTASSPSAPFYTAPDVVLNSPYSYLGVQATGGTGGYTYSYTYPFYNTLPAGLTLNSDGSITGTDTTDPSGAMVTAIISATDSSNSTISGYFTFTVDNALSAMSATAPTVIDPGQTNYSWDGDAVTGGTSPITYSYTGTTPDGLTFDPASGTFSGTPAADVAPESVTVTATDALGNTESQAYDFTVAAPLSFVSTTDPPTIYPNETNFSWDGDTVTGGVAPYTYSDGNATPDGLSFDTTTGELSGTVSANATDTQVDVFASDASGVVIEHTYALIVGDQLAFVSTADPTVIDPGQTSYTWDGDTATGGSPNATFPYYTYSAEPSTFDGLTFNPDTGEFSGSPTTNAVDTQVDVFATDSAGNVIGHTYNFIVGAPLAFQSTANPPTIYPGETGFSWNGDAATGGVTPYTYSDGDTTPDGLSFNTATGEFSGTVSNNATDMQVDVFVTDSDGSVIENTYAFIVGSPLAFQSTANPPTIYAGEPNFSWNGDAATGGVTPYTYSDGGTTPDGLSFNTATGEFSGNVSSPATDMQVDVFVTDSDGSVIENTYEFIVGSSLAIGTGTPPTLTDGAGGYSFNGAEASGGNGTYTYALTSGVLPTGLSLNTTSGLISQLGAADTTATATTQTFSVTVTDGLGDTSTGQFTITAVPEAVVTTGGGGGGGGSTGGGTSTPASQSPLALTSITGFVGTPLVLTSTGETGTGAVTYVVTTIGTAGCVISGGALSASAVGTCTVTVSQAASATGNANSSAPTSVTFVAATPAVVLPVNPHAYKVVGKVHVRKSTTISILGSGFYGQPKILSNAFGIKSVVLRDTGSKLTVKVALSALAHAGEHTFTIILANGKSCKINYRIFA
jgi:hypothetical protein